ncbi:hypothetical protein BT63DRAFT_140877 [Microthyrium microscopicum]|uniref:Uncharacterized protein n=1 Tax=Microthyrium microscopicum TaxID=703497 RepID=A0A6A6UL45_9PEZI|nr:hypothetical protein BT63DRAFT_140877 [Microthyrium microscopicum]
MAEMSLSWIPESECNEVNQEVDLGEFVVVLFYCDSDITHSKRSPVARLWFPKAPGAVFPAYQQHWVIFTRLAGILSTFASDQVYYMLANDLTSIDKHLTSIRGSWPLAPAGVDVTLRVFFHLLIHSTIPPSNVAAGFMDLKAVCLFLADEILSVDPDHEDSILIKFAGDLHTAANSAITQTATTAGSSHATVASAANSSNTQAGNNTAPSNTAGLSAGRLLAMRLSQDAAAAPRSDASHADPSASSDEE